MNRKRRLRNKKKKKYSIRVLKSKKVKNTNQKPIRMSFNLLYLPLLAIQNCIRCLTLFQFLDFSLLSQRTKRISSSIKRNPIRINLVFNEESSLYFTLPNFQKKEWLIDFMVDLEPFKKKSYRTINGKPVLSTIRRNTYRMNNGEKKTFHRLILKSENCLETLAWIVEHIKMVFRSSIRLIDIDGYKEPIEEIFEWLSAVNPAIDSVYLGGENTVFPGLLWFILKRFQINQSLTLSLKPSHNLFSYTDGIHVPTLLVDHSYWITLKTILNSKNSIISLEGSRLTAMDLNRLMKHWLGGWNTNLECAKIVRKLGYYEDEDENFKILTKGIEFKEESEDNGRPTQLNRSSGSIFHTLDGTYYEMTRNDGMMAAFLQCYINEDDIPVHYFVFQVWNR